MVVNTVIVQGGTTGVFCRVVFDRRLKTIEFRKSDGLTLASVPIFAEHVPVGRGNGIAVKVRGTRFEVYRDPAKVSRIRVRRLNGKMKLVGRSAVK